MAEKKPVAKKKATKKKATKKRAPAKPKVEMVSYEMGMTIPTGQYANIMPRVIVKGGTMEEAHDFIAPHMNKLWKEYYLINERKVVPPTPKPEPVATPAPAPVVAPAPTPAPTQEPEVGTPVAPVAEASPVSSVAMTKATQAIQSCTSNDALNLIIDQIEKSVKLTNADKDLLLPMASEKFEKDFKNKQ